MVIGMEKYDRLFPTRRHAVRPAFSTVLTFTISCPYFFDFDVIDSLHSISYLSLVGLLVHFEGVRTLNVCKVHPLFGNQGPNYDVIVIQVNTRQLSFV